MLLFTVTYGIQENDWIKSVFIPIQEESEKTKATTAITYRPNLTCKQDAVMDY